MAAPGGLDIPKAETDILNGRIVRLEALVAELMARPPPRDGVNGQDGVPGMDGMRGRDGVQGRDGMDGRPGMDGLQGRDGKDANLETNANFIALLDVVRQLEARMTALEILDRKTSPKLPPPLP